MPESPVGLSVQQPCAENWATMTPAAQGRHCASCDKIVVDFTRMTDPELIRWFARPADPVCGRFRPDQLDRPLSPQSRPLPPRWQAWLAAGAVAWTLQALAPTAAAAQRLDRPTQRLVPLVTRPQAPRPAAAAAEPTSQPDEPLRIARPLLTGILGGVVVGIRPTVLEPPPRPALLRLEDWLR